jgi:hypothetical protein
MMQIAAELLYDYQFLKTPNDVKRVIALFAGQAALEDDRIIQKRLL